MMSDAHTFCTSAFKMKWLLKHITNVHRIAVASTSAFKMKWLLKQEGVDVRPLQPVVQVPLKWNDYWN